VVKEVNLKNIKMEKTALENKAIKQEEIDLAKIAKQEEKAKLAEEKAAAKLAAAEDKNKSKKISKKQAEEMEDQVDIVALKDKHMKEGKTYSVTKETAILLINKGAAKLK
jgi:hypothetical protein